MPFFISHKIKLFWETDKKRNIAGHFTRQAGCKKSEECKNRNPVFF
jgi:hypothetical protein